jgi:hypothetical protein
MFGLGMNGYRHQRPDVSEEPSEKNDREELTISRRSQTRSLIDTLISLLPTSSSFDPKQ